MAQSLAPVDRYHVPETASAEAEVQLETNYSPRRERPAAQRPASIADWDKQSAQAEAMLAPRAKQIADSLGVTTIADEIGGIAVLRIRPAHYKPSRQKLLYIHGGGYVTWSAKSSLIVPSLIAAAGGEEIISIDYTLAPHGTWRSITDEILAVWGGLLAGGAKPSAIGLFGDSAGGGLAAGSVLKMRDQGMPLPGALWLLSPWSDITVTGDSYTTLAAADPILSSTGLAWGAEAYAPISDQKNPYVSPVYGDYTKPFPPTLIQVGTREIFLSNAVRQYQAIRGGAHEAVLDVYEGMPHIFPSQIPNSPEARTAIARAVTFFKANLKR